MSHGDDIERAVKTFAQQMTLCMEKARAAFLRREGADDAAVVRVRFDMSRAPASRGRTPQQQAAQVAAGRSWSCSGSHMGDAARHVRLLVTPAGGRERVTWATSDAFGNALPFFMTQSAFESEWTSTMSRNDLLNYAHRPGWSRTDSFHLELKEGRPDRSDPAVQACLAEYVRLTRGPKGKPNNKFEMSAEWAALLRPLLARAGSGPTS